MHVSGPQVGRQDGQVKIRGFRIVKVTRVIIEADKAGKHIASADLFSHPTPRQLSTISQLGFFDV